MATAQNVIDRAGARLGLVEPNGALNANESADALEVLQDIIAELSEDGGLEIPAPSTLATSLDVSPGTIRGLADILAWDYADYIGKALQETGRIQRRADQARTRLLGQSTISREISYRRDGLAVPSGRYNIESDT